MLTRVSSIETYRRWRLDEEATFDDLIERLTSFQPNEAMLAGTAFHKALELAKPGDYETLYANGYTFHLPDGELALPAIRELRGIATYGPLRVTGQVDALDGRRVDDHKTTGRFNPDSYLEGCSWKFYLDLFEADVFRWNIFEIHEIKPMAYQVGAMHTLEQYRYPRMHEDCMRLAADFYAVTNGYLPETPASLAA